MNLPERKTQKCSGLDCRREIVCDVELPLENAAFAINQYLEMNAKDLDPQTRALLLGVSACVLRAAEASREIRTGSVASEEATPIAAGNRWVA